MYLLYRIFDEIRKVDLQSFFHFSLSESSENLWKSTYQNNSYTYFDKRAKIGDGSNEQIVIGYFALIIVCALFKKVFVNKNLKSV